MSLQSRFSMQFALTAGLAVALSLAASLAMFGMRVDDMSTTFRGTLEAALEKQLRRDGERTLAKLSEDIKTALVDYDRPMLEEAAAEGMATSGAQSIRIYDSRGRGLADGAGDARALIVPPPTPMRGLKATDGVVRWREGDSLMMGKAVCIRDACLGAIAIAVDGAGIAQARAAIDHDMDRAEAGFLGRYLMLGIASLAVITLIAALTGYVLGFRLTKGLKAAIRAIDRLAEGAANVRVEPDGKNLADLAEAVDALAQKLDLGSGVDPSIVDEMADGVFVAKADGEFVIANPAFHALFGAEAATLIGADAFATFRIDPVANPEAFAAALSEISEIRTLDGRDAPVIVQATVTQGEAPEDVRILGVARDAGDRAQREQELLTATMRAAAAEKAKSEFLAVMSHELRTPLNGVLGGAAVLAGSALDANQQKLVGVVQNSGKALLSTIGDILDYSRAESGEESVVSEPVSLDALVQKIAASVAEQAAAKGLTVKVHVQPGAPVVMADAEKLLRIGASLAENAVKFTESGQVTIKLNHTATDGTAAISLAVADTGPGVPEDQQEKIFDQFTQGDSSLTRAQGGAGMGLALAKKLTQMIGGKLSLSSAPGAGATFTVGLSAQLAAKPGRAAQPLGRTRALVVDPAADARAEVEGQLAGAGASVDTAATAGQAMEMLDAARAQGAPYDLVVHPEDLPEMAESGLREALSGSDPERQVVSVARTKIASNGEPALSPFARRVSAGSPSEKLIAAASEAVAGKRQSLKGTAPRPAARASDGAPADQSHDVVLAEDNEVNRVVLSAYLRKAGFTCHTAANGFEAVKLYKEVRPCLVLMTLNMPLMSGLDATKAIRRFEADNNLAPTPVIALSAQVRELDRERGTAAGIDDFLAKPVRIDELDAKLERWTELFGRNAAVSAAS